MTREITQFNAAQVLPADRRRAGRACSRVQGGGVVRQTSMDVETDVTVNKLDNITVATGSGMRAVITVAQAQQALEQTMPTASGRLALLADDHAIGVADTLADQADALAAAHGSIAQADAHSYVTGLNPLE